ncbi:MDR family oxidoreductase [Ferruginivarius sediminum]|uniref:Oxidoreductase n=1 Tax=Ferruginivarius sediminum TaxID=2661937 RepID=A0A369T7X7_9PROT|nr:MDR family oxidoreductase [Ferruginivarius sediminum]RDD60455.1 oxidoreductase [Ferruginivarius sediminum]
MVKALVLHERDEGIEQAFEDLDESRLKERLPDGDVTVRVQYTTLNYKDGMVLNGLGRLVRSYPHIPGIDFAGEVEESDNPDYKPGDKVVLTGWRVGEAHWGGYAEKARVKGKWLVPLPDGLTAQRAMALGTAGFTAMLAVMALEEHGLKPAKDEQVLVTGAAGGVGSVATAVLANLGYNVAAVTGRAETHDYLRDLGATEIIDRAELNEPSKKPLEAERWAACVDAVGGAMLGRVLGQMAYGRAVAAVGLAGGPEVKTTVLPFLLRGVNLLGIDSVMCPTDRRLTAWKRLAKEMPQDKLDEATQTAKLEDLPRLGKEILEGKVRGRTVVEV